MLPMFSTYSLAESSSLLLKIAESVHSSSEVTKSQHDEFWNKIDSMSQDDANRIITMYRNTFIYGLEIQTAIWKAVLHASKTGNANMPDDLFKLISRLNGIHLDQFKSGLSYPEGSENYVNAVNKMKKVMEENLEDTKQIITAAANNSSILLDDGTEAVITRELIEYTLSGINSRFIALNKLLDKTWID